MDQPWGVKKGSRLPEVTKRTILMLKQAHPDWGLSVRVVAAARQDRRGGIFFSGYHRGGAREPLRRRRILGDAGVPRARYRRAFSAGIFGGERAGDRSGKGLQRRSWRVGS
jgi:hypothetical protein